jgi:hypothetical protein
MASLNPPLTKDDFINSPWQDVVNSSETKDCRTYNFWKKAEEAQEAGNVREQAVFGILAFATRRTITPESTEDDFARAFQDLTEEHLDFLAEIAPEISDPELQAQVADILWNRRRQQGGYQMAKLAITAYLQSATELENSNEWTLISYRIERALRLASTIKCQDQVEAVVAHIKAVLDRYNGKDPCRLSAELMGLLQDKKLKLTKLLNKDDPTKYAALAEKAATLAESAHDWDRARAYWEIKARWHLIEKDGEKERAALMLATQTYVKEAEKALKGNHAPYLKASCCLREALDFFKKKIRDAGKETAAVKAAAEEVHKLLLQYQEESMKELMPFSQEADISKKVEKVRAFVTGKQFQEALFSFALLGASPKVSHLRQVVKNTAILHQLFPIEMVNKMGKVVASQSSDPGKAEEATRFQMYMLAVINQKGHAQARIEPARDQINLEHSIRLDDLRPIVSHSPFVQPEREYLFAKGLYAGLTGDFITSTHILIPQIEESVRYLLRKRGAITSRDDDKGIQNENDLNKTLYPRNYPEITSIFDEDTLFDLQGLLVEHSGSNLRNLMAHGLINDDGFLSPLMSYLWWLALRLCCLPILIHQQNVEQSDPWVKFAGMFKDDPLFDEFVEDMAAYRRELDAEVPADEATPGENQPA